jgi:hypothetical protein
MKGWHVKNSRIIVGILLLVLAEGLLGCLRAHGQMEIEAKKRFNLDAAPLDIASSLEGTKIFVLVEGKVLVYSVSDDRLTDAVPVDRDLDRLTLTPRGNLLVLSSSSGKRIELVSLRTIVKIDVSRLPFKGPENAPVTIAVFSDYQ